MYVYPNLLYNNDAWNESSRFLINLKPICLNFYNAFYLKKILKMISKNTLFYLKKHYNGFFHTCFGNMLEQRLLFEHFNIFGCYLLKNSESQFKYVNWRVKQASPFDPPLNDNRRKEVIYTLHYMYFKSILEKFS